jgi:hypothetical protein
MKMKKKEHGSRSTSPTPTSVESSPSWDPINLDCRNMDLKSFEDVYNTIIEFSKQNTTVKYDFQKLNLYEIDVSDNKMTHFFDANNYPTKSVRKLTSV